MSFSDSLENNLKNLEASDEHDAEAVARTQRQKQSQRAGVLAAAPFAEKLKTGAFAPGLFTSVTRIGHGLRTKVNIIWLGTTLRLQAREHKLELRPTPEGVVAYFLVNDKEIRNQKLDLESDPELLAQEWLGMVGPRPAPEPAYPEEESPDAE
jgi:hypothetical protein